ncbi:MAG: hypothetical protein ABIP44_06910 [Pseudoxanthomonas sp.]
MRRLFAPVLLLLGLPFVLSASAPPTPLVGLSVRFENGVGPDLARIGDPLRFLQEIDVISTRETSTDRGIAPVIESGDLAALDWRGIQLVEEDWRAPGDGTWTRMRFYLGARWMQSNGAFVALGTDARGFPVGKPLVMLTGTDGQWRRQGLNADDAFVRRFNARQVTTGCRAKHDCSNATRFKSQALVQLRVALHPEQDAARIDRRAHNLTLWWSEQPLRLRKQALVSPTPAQAAYGYGFQPSLQLVTPPANGSYYQPGESLRARITLRDGQGVRLHPAGSLPTYGQFLRGEIPSGLRYFDGFTLEPTTYYAFKHREGNSFVTLSGPTDKLRTPRATTGIEQFFMPQAVSASTVPDGFTGLASLIPGTVFPGAFGQPELWETPVSDEVVFTLPLDAQAGTYVMAVKFRREFAGESLNRGSTLNLQVGNATPTAFNPGTGQCATCHAGPSTLANVLHGIGDRSACYACHSPLTFEPDGALDIRVHMVHSRSKRFPGNINDCGLCHTRTPTGPFRNSGEDGSTVMLSP